MASIDPKYSYHVPVLVREAIHYLITDPSGLYVDATLGGGGYSEVIFSSLDHQGRVIGIDRDADAVAFAAKRLASYSDRLTLVHNDFGGIDEVFHHHHVDRIDGIVFDLGVSSHQIDEPERGFSYLTDGPLDMRMNRQDTLTAWDVVNTYSREDLADLFYYYGEERHARRYARNLVEIRDKKPIQTTGEFAECVKKWTSPKWQIKTLSRLFQAIRIEVNGELRQLEDALVKSGRILKPGGRIVVVTYHSLEAKIVKRFVRGEIGEFDGETEHYASDSPFKLITKKAVAPSDEEIEGNTRARSAYLRVVEKKVA